MNPQAPKRRTVLHYARNTAACLCLVLCIGFVALWVQSYNGDAYGIEIGGGVFFLNKEGDVSFVWKEVLTKKDVKWEVDKSIKLDYEAAKQSTPSDTSIKPFDPYAPGVRRDVTVPHWFLVLPTGTLAILLKQDPD